MALRTAAKTAIFSIPSVGLRESSVNPVACPTFAWPKEQARDLPESDDHRGPQRLPPASRGPNVVSRDYLLRRRRQQEWFDVLVSHSDDNGATWSAPVVTLAGQTLIIQFSLFQMQPGFDYDKPWINTHVDAGQSNWVYVTATRFNNFTPGLSPIAIHFARSSNKGASFAGPTTLEKASGNVVIQGPDPAGGEGGEVVVSWYNSGTDGFLSGSFQIHTCRSSDHGATFDPVVVAATDSFELPFALGPFSFYERWWGGMFPSLAIDAGGGAHIVYTHDPVDPRTPAGFASAESGDIRYISSGGPPYSFWSSPITVNDDGLERAQGFPAINTQHDGTVDVVWIDHRLSPTVSNSTPFQCFVQGICNSSNLLYDVFYARKVPGHPAFFPNFRVSDTSSIVQFDFIGDYIGLAASGTDLFAVWTDRRNRTSIFQTDNDVFGSHINCGRCHAEGKVAVKRKVLQLRIWWVAV